ncbi:MAG TPA: glycosyltransferase [Polyangiales bacterium]|nr:glycosyltransferase [Polyangiales bacterium]
MAAEPRVTVMMPVHNAQAYLREALDSVLGQSYPHWELVAIDDSSSDDSFALLQEYAAREPRLRVFRQPEQRGIVAARNRALENADPQSRYLAILDADDVALPDRLAAQVAFLEAHPDHALVGGQTLIIDEHSRPLGIRRYPLDYAQICRVITRWNPIAQSAAMLRRSQQLQVGGYDPNFPRCQDYDLWLRIAARFPVANLDRPVIRYRISAAQGKRTHLRQTLALTLQLQRRWLLHPRFFQAYNAAYVAAEHLLPLLPDAAILALFKRVRYQDSGQAQTSER